MTSAKTVTATFDIAFFTLGVTVNDDLPSDGVAALGSIAVSGWQVTGTCAKVDASSVRCQYTLPYSSSVTLVATPTGGSTFARFQSSLDARCTTTSTSCTFPMPGSTIEVTGYFR